MNAPENVQVDVITPMTDASISKGDHQIDVQGDFIARDSMVYGDQIAGDKISGNKIFGDEVNGHKLVATHMQVSFSEENKISKFELFTLSEDKTVIVNRDSVNCFVKQLQKNHLIVIQKHPSIHIETILRQVVQVFLDERRILSIWRWVEGEDHFDLENHFLAESAVQKGSGIYQYLDASSEIINHIEIPNLRRRLEQREQYLILTTTSPDDTWKLKSLYPEIWCGVPENGYDLTYLTDELSTALANTKNLPFADRFRVRSESLLLGTKVRDLASKLGTLSNIDVFVAYVDMYDNIDNELIEKGVEEVLSQDFDKKIHYLYEQLADDQQRLLAGGLCLFAGLSEELFFRSLQKIIQGPWQHLFRDIIILDYFHLAPLHAFITYREQTVEPRHSPAQFEPLFRIVWQDYQYHIRRVIPLLIELIEESVQQIGERAKTDEERNQHRQLRHIASQVLSLMGMLSPQSVESYLTELATGTNWGIQATAARAIAQWHKNSKVGKTQCVNLLTKWEADIRGKKGDYTLDEKNIYSTIVRTLSYILSENKNVALSETLCSLAFRLLFCPNKDLCRRAEESILPKLLTTDIDQVIKIWTTSNPVMWADVTPEVYISRIVTVSQAFDKCGHLNDISSWLVEQLQQGVRQSYLSSFKSLDKSQLEWLIENILLPNIERSAHLLLLLIQIERLQNSVSTSILKIYNDHPNNFLSVTLQWYEQYQHDLSLTNKEKIRFWANVLPSIGSIFKMVDLCDEYDKWIDIWFEQEELSDPSEMASVLVEIDRRLAMVDSNLSDIVHFGDSTTKFSMIENKMLERLAHEHVESKLCEIAMCYYYRRFDQRSANSLINSELRHIPLLVLHIVAPLNASRRLKLQNLFPLANEIFRRDKGMFSKIIQRWKRFQNREMNKIATVLNRIVRWSPMQGSCHGGCIRGIIILPFSITPVIRKLVQSLWFAIKRSLR